MAKFLFGEKLWKNIGMKKHYLSDAQINSLRLRLAAVKAGKILKQEKVEQGKLSIMCHLENTSRMKLNEEKDLLSNSCHKCIDLTAQVAKLEIENMQLQSTCSGNLKEINELRKIIQEANQTIADLTDKRASKEEPVNLLDEQIYFPAKQIGELPQNQSPSKETSIVREVENKKRNNRELDQSISTEGISRPMKHEERPIGNEINEREIYDTRANEESAIALLQLNLKQREMDVFSLKKQILNERVEVKLLLEQKEAKYTEDILKVQSVLAKTRVKLNKSKERSKTLLSEIKQIWSDKMFRIQSIFAESQAADKQRIVRITAKYMEGYRKMMREFMMEKTKKMKKHYEDIANKRIEKMQAQLFNEINLHTSGKCLSNTNTTN